MDPQHSTHAADETTRAKQKPKNSCINCSSQIHHLFESSVMSGRHHKQQKLERGVLVYVGAIASLTSCQLRCCWMIDNDNDDYAPVFSGRSFSFSALGLELGTRNRRLENVPESRMPLVDSGTPSSEHVAPFRFQMADGDQDGTSNRYSARILE
ncbi:hypothetical protein GALMADRAFT_254202 [Galerina marginata CBS 339.88]|uniref:Uncharacterized protein n=1 Tax=Galerina marginata (strain CBS 339.88) TaxID=685588 RepID=A0A067STN3_GALM3|nr:hypothetical protein GALMADRAFT_254202 [Galerina marginata CBS 339.88]